MKCVLEFLKLRNCHLDLAPYNFFFSVLNFVCILSTLAADFAFRLWVVFMGFGTPGQVMENTQNVGYKQWPADGAVDEHMMHHEFFLPVFNWFDGETLTREYLYKCMVKKTMNVAASSIARPEF